MKFSSFVDSLWGMGHRRHALLHGLSWCQSTWWLFSCIVSRSHPFNNGCLSCSVRMQIRIIWHTRHGVCRDSHRLTWSSPFFFSARLRVLRIFFIRIRSERHVIASRRKYFDLTITNTDSKAMHNGNTYGLGFDLEDTCSEFDFLELYLYFVMGEKKVYS